MTIKYFSGVECGGTFTLTAALTAPVTSCLSVYTTSFALLLALPISNLIKEKLRKNHHVISKKYFFAATEHRRLALTDSAFNSSV